MPRPVNSKEDFTRRYLRGEFGNCSPSWPNARNWYEAAYMCGEAGTDTLDFVHLRNRIKGGPTHYNVPVWKLAQYCRLSRHWVHDPCWYISLMAPEDDKILQGEICRSSNGLNLFGSFLALPMRVALLEKPFNVTGLAALMTLKSKLDAVSYDWVQELLDLYPEHIIEFSAYSRPWGTLNYNTVIWEVRLY
jgi:hypothetical protein